MAKGRNCPNCGAVIEPNNNKCAYCGTSYLDLSAIDFTNHQPIYLKIKTNINGNDVYITQLVRPSLETMTFDTETVEAQGSGGKLLSFVCGQTLTTNINFTAIRDTNNHLVTIEALDEHIKY